MIDISDRAPIRALQSDAVRRGSLNSEFLVGTVTFGVLMLAAAGYGAVTIAATTLSLSLAISIASLIRAVRLDGTSPIRLTAFIYLIFFFQLPGLLHLTTGRYPWYGITYSADVERDSTLAILIFVLSFLAGIFVAGRTSKGKRTSASDIDEQRMSKFLRDTIERRQLVVVISLLAISIGTGLVIGYHPFTRRSELFELTGVKTPGKLILEAVSSACGALAFLISLARYFQKSSAGWMAMVLMSFVPFLLANNPLSSPRYVTGSLILTTTFLIVRPGPRGKLALVLAMMFAQFTIFPLLSDVTRGGGAESYQFAPLRYLSEHGDFDGLQSTNNVVDWVETHGPKMGRQIISAVFFFVPRTIFPSKSPGTGGEAADFAGYKFINISAPLPAEFFSDFGFVGLPFLAFGVGFLLQRFDARYDRAARSSDWIQMLVPAFTAGYVFILLRGSLVGVLGPFACTVGIAYLVTKFLSARNRWV